MVDVSITLKNVPDNIEIHTFHSVIEKIRGALTLGIELEVNNIPNEGTKAGTEI